MAVRYSTGSSRGFGLRRRPTFADGLPSVVTTSAVKSFSPRIERRADAVRVDRHAALLERADPLDVEAARDDDLHVVEALRVETRAHLLDQALVDTAGVEVAHLAPQGAVDERRRRVEPHAPELRAERMRDGEGGAHRVVLEVDEDDDVRVVGRELGELLRGEHRVAAVGRDQRVRHGSDPDAAPPGRLRVGGDADRAGDVRRIAVTGLNAVMVVPRREEQDRLAVRRLDHPPRVRGDERPPREDAQVHRLEMRERRVVALDRQHRLPGRDLVAVVERLDLERVPVVDTELEDGDRLVHPAEHRVLLLERLHVNLRPAPVVEQHLAREVEVDVGVVALPHLLDREVEDLRWEALLPVLRHRRAILGAGTRPEPLLRPRAARASARR